METSSEYAASTAWKEVGETDGCRELSVDSYNNLGQDFYAEELTENNVLITCSQATTVKIDCQPPHKPINRFEGMTAEMYSSFTPANSVATNVLASYAASVANDTALLTDTISPSIEKKKAPEIIGPTSCLSQLYETHRNSKSKTETVNGHNKSIISSIDYSSAINTTLPLETSKEDYQTRPVSKQLVSQVAVTKDPSSNIYNRNKFYMTYEQPFFTTESPTTTTLDATKTSKESQEMSSNNLMKRAPKFENISRITQETMQVNSPKLTTSTESLTNLTSETDKTVVSSQINNVQTVLSTVTSKDVMMMATPITSVNIFLSNFMKGDQEMKLNSQVKLNVSEKSDWQSKMATKTVTTATIVQTSTPQKKDTQNMKPIDLSLKTEEDKKDAKISEVSEINLENGIDSEKTLKEDKSFTIKLVPDEQDETKFNLVMVESETSLKNKLDFQASKSIVNLNTIDKDTEKKLLVFPHSISIQDLKTVHELVAPVKKSQKKLPQTPTEALETSKNSLKSSSSSLHLSQADLSDLDSKKALSKVC